MLHQVRDYWLPMMLFTAAMFCGVGLLLFVVAAPLLNEYTPVRHALLQLFADDATVRRSSIAGAIGVIVTAFIFFRPKVVEVPRKTPLPKAAHDSMAGMDLR